MAGEPRYFMLSFRYLGSSGPGPGGAGVAFPSRGVRRVAAPTSGATRRFLLFEAGGFRCGLDVRILREVIEDAGIAPAGGGPRPLLGSLPLQGETLPTVDLGGLFEGSGASRRVLVVEAEGRRLGFLVERTLEVADLPEAAFRPLPALATRLLPGTVRAVTWQGERPVFLLDGESLGPLLQTAVEEV